MPVPSVPVGASDVMGVFGVIAVFLSLAGSVLPAKILVLLPMPGYSHTMPYMPIFKELGKRGHELTMVTPFPQDPTPKGFKQVNVDLDLPTLKKTIVSSMGGAGPSIRSSFALGVVFQALGLWILCPTLTKVLVEKAVEVMPPPGTKFDLVITEPFFCMEPLLAASHLYNAPVVATLPMPLSPLISGPTGNPDSFAYVPLSRIPYTDRMTFLQRVWNTAVGVIEIIVTYILHFPLQDKLMRDLLQNPDIPSIKDLSKNISLVLTETHFSLNYPRAYHKNILEVGGVSLESFKPLPKDLEKFMNDAKGGVILFSWGSHTEVDNEDELVQIMMNTFSRLKQKVIFKWAQTDIPNKPDNVLIQKWVPQPAVLEHKNTILFISHCGINSVYEAVNFGVPVLGTPLFGDQPYNMKILEDIGMGISMTIQEIEDGTDAFYRTINKIISDPSFRENAQKRKAMFRDRPMPVLDEAVYWIEYVMRHDGGKHMRPASADLPWYSLVLIDVFIFIFMIIFIPFYVLYLCIKRCFCRKAEAAPPKAASKGKKKSKKE